jgi:hypothetical protein
LSLLKTLLTLTEGIPHAWINILDQPAYWPVLGDSRGMASDDLDFEAKAADIIALYLNPPHHAAVFCVDEKSAIQAFDRLDPVLPLSPGRIERHRFEYFRHGTLSLYAGQRVQSKKIGSIIGYPARKRVLTIRRAR